MSKSPLRVAYAPDAYRDLIEKAAYLEEEGGLPISDRFLQATSHTIELLRNMPKMGNVFRSGAKGQTELRTISISRPFHRSIIFYTATTVELRIERISMAHKTCPAFSAKPRLAIPVHLSDNREWP
jgi:plasmid stabilization system protein ParE